jgi:hypothetical protein
MAGTTRTLGICMSVQHVPGLPDHSGVVPQRHKNEIPIYWLAVLPHLHRHEVRWCGPGDHWIPCLWCRTLLGGYGLSGPEGRCRNDILGKQSSGYSASEKRHNRYQPNCLATEISAYPFLFPSLS